MPSRDLRLFLTDILQAIDKVERYTVGLSPEEFEANDMVVDAVVRNLEIIGEAARQVPPNSGRPDGGFGGNEGLTDFRS